VGGIGMEGVGDGSFKLKDTVEVVMA